VGKALVDSLLGGEGGVGDSGSSRQLKRRWFDSSALRRAQGELSSGLTMIFSILALTTYLNLRVLFFRKAWH